MEEAPHPLPSSLALAWFALMQPQKLLESAHSAGIRYPDGLPLKILRLPRPGREERRQYLRSVVAATLLWAPFISILILAALWVVLVWPTLLFGDPPCGAPEIPLTMEAARWLANQPALAWSFGAILGLSLWPLGVIAGLIGALARGCVKGVLATGAAMLGLGGAVLIVTALELWNYTLNPLGSDGWILVSFLALLAAVCLVVILPVSWVCRSGRGLEENANFVAVSSLFLLPLEVPWALGCLFLQRLLGVRTLPRSPVCFHELSFSRLPGVLAHARHSARIGDAEGLSVFAVAAQRSPRHRDLLEQISELRAASPPPAEDEAPPAPIHYSLPLDPWFEDPPWAKELLEQARWGVVDAYVGSWFTAAVKSLPLAVLLVMAGCYCLSFLPILDAELWHGGWLPALSGTLVLIAFSAALLGFVVRLAVRAYPIVILPPLEALASGSEVVSRVTALGVPLLLLGAGLAAAYGAQEARTGLLRASSKGLTFSPAGLAFAATVEITAFLVTLAVLAGGTLRRSARAPSHASLRSLERAADSEGAEPRAELTLAHLSDLHIVASEDALTAEGKSGGNRALHALMTERGSAFREADVVLLTGDVTDAGAGAEWQAFFETPGVDELEERLVLVPGNHDVNIVDNTDFSILETGVRPLRQIRLIRMIAALDRVQGDRAWVVQDGELVRLTEFLSGVWSQILACLAAPPTVMTQPLGFPVHAKGGTPAALFPRPPSPDDSVPSTMWRAIFPMVVDLPQESFVLFVLNSNPDAASIVDNAFGEIEPEQLARLEWLQDRFAGRAMVYGLHHHVLLPPDDAGLVARVQARFMTLRNAAQVLECLRSRPSPAVFHGHRHLDYNGALIDGTLVMSAFSSTLGDEWRGTSTPGFFRYRLAAAKGAVALAELPTRFEATAPPGEGSTP